MVLADAIPLESEWIEFARSKSALLANALMLKFRENGYHAEARRLDDGTFQVCFLPPCRNQPSKRLARDKPASPARGGGW